MTRTLSLIAAIVLTSLLSVQMARVALQPMAGVSTNVATTAAEPPAVDGTAKAIEDLAAWPMAAGR